MNWMIIAIVIVAVIALVYIMLYNKLVRLQTWIEEASSQIGVQLQRRMDLIPNLVSSVKGYTKHEQETLTKVVSLRNQMMEVKADDVKKQADLDLQLSSQLKSVFALAENYPNLKADAEFRQLMEELSNTENKVAYSRQAYNSNVATFEAAKKSFPGNIVAGLGHFKEFGYLEVNEAAKEAPKVSFD